MGKGGEKGIWEYGKKWGGGEGVEGLVDEFEPQLT